MRTDVSEDGPFERLITLTFPEEELESAKDAVARKLSREMKIKGFRPGKAPRAVVERMVGSDSLRSEAIDEALPEMVGTAITDAELAPVTTPRIENIRDTEDGEVEVEVRITLWPTLDEVPSLERTVEVEPPEVDEEELQAQIDRLRGQFAELEDVSREADEGDFVMINLSAFSNGVEVEEAAASDLLYEIGSRSFIPGLDEMLVGSSAGDIREGPASLPDGFGEHAGTEVNLRVLVKGVRAKRLPDVTDEWVADISEYDSVEDLYEEVGQNLRAMKLGAVAAGFQDQVMEQLVGEMDLDLPDALVQAEMDASLHNLAHTLEAQELNFGDYLQIVGQDQEAFLDELRERSTRALLTRILLEAIAEDRGLEVDDDEIEDAITQMALQTRRDREDVRRTMAESGQEQALAGDILRRKALDSILEVATAVDAAGDPVDLSPPQTDEDSEDEEDQEPDEVLDESASDDGDAETIEDFDAAADNSVVEETA